MSENKDETLKKQDLAEERIINLQQTIDTLQTTILEANNVINSQMTIIKEKDVELFTMREQLEFVLQENASYDMLMGYSPNMTYSEKLKLNEDSERELERAKNCLDSATLKEYESAIEKEDRLIDCALEQNQLQFEISELFKNIKRSVREESYEDYKKYKRSFYTLIDGMYKIVEEPIEKIDMFDILIDVIEKQKKVYQIDEEIKNLK